MRSAYVTLRRELRSYFGSPIAYIIMAVFVVIEGYFFIEDLAVYMEATINGFIYPAEVILLFLSPVITMRLLAEEQKTGTFELLLTAPIREIEVVVAKFLASLVLLVLMLWLTLFFTVVLFLFGDPDWGPIATGYFGLVLLGASYLSVGILASSLTSNQIVAAVLATGMLVIIYFINGAASFVSGLPADILTYISLSSHYDGFAKGIIDTKDIVYYLSFVAVFLFLTVRFMETRRWW